MSSRRIGNYQITDYIGSGGFGSVFKAEDTSAPGRVVAIKELHKKHTRNAVIKQRFFQEAVAMARLDHANLPRLFTFGEDNGSYYLVMEFLSGRQLTDELQNGPIPAASAVTIMAQALEALSYAHRNGIIHRDLKPDNIMLLEGDSLRVKVLDFGIARMVGGENLTLAGEGFGTPAYMSPERLSGSTSDDPRIDIYSAGIILFEMLTGNAPFNSSASDPVIYWSEMRKQHESDPLPLTSSNIPAELQQVISRATAKRIEDRYQTADEMLAELNSISGDRIASAADAGASATRLFLTIVPAAAEVHVDDQLRGTSDAIRGKILIDKLAPGLHSVRVSKAGYSDYRINVALEEGRQTDLQVALQARATVAMPPADRTAAGGFDTVRLEGNEAKTALFVVESLPAGATILIGSEEVARADEDGRATIKLAPGQHEIEARATTGEITRGLVTVATQDAGSFKTIAMPVKQTSEANQTSAAKQALAPSGSLIAEKVEQPRMNASEIEKPTKSKRMAAAAVIVLLLALAAVAYVVLRGPSRGNTQSDAVGNQAVQQSNAASSNPSPPLNQESVIAEQRANTNRAEERTRAQETQNANTEKQAAEEKPPTEESSTTTPTPPVPTAPPSQPEAPPQEACLVVRVAGPGGNTVHRAKVTMIVQSDTSSASILNPGKSPNGLWSQCGLAAGNRVRVVVTGPKGGARAGRMIRDVTLSPGKNSVEIQVSELRDDSPDREPPPFPGRKRPRLQRP